MDEDIPLPADLPAAELKWAQCRVSWLQAAKDRSQAWASQAGAKTERDPKPPTSPLPLARQGRVWGMKSGSRGEG